MKVLRIAKINTCRTFHDFTWPTTLPDFQDYNLIYGWNGTGKTTISDILRAVERKQTEFEGEFTVVTDQGQVKSDDLAGTWAAQIPPIRVFNREYVNENLFSPKNGTITPIFYLGKESVEKQKLVEEKTGLLAAAQESHRLKLEEKKQHEKSLDDLAVKGAKAVKDALLSSGSNPYNNYDKRGLKTKIDAMIATGAVASSFAQTDEEKAELKARFSGALKESLVLPAFSLADLEARRSVVDALLKRSVVSNTLAALQDNENLAAWVQQGLDIHHEGKHKDCQFCLQPLPAARVKDLEGHFNDAYSLIMEDIAAEVTQIDAGIASIDNFSFVDKSAVCDHLTARYAEAVAPLRLKLAEYGTFLRALKSHLETKKAKPFVQSAVTEETPSDAAVSLKAYTDTLAQHNSDCTDHAAAVTAARKKYEEAIVAGYLDEYKELKQSAENAQTEAAEINTAIKTLGGEIRTLEIEIKEHRKPAEEINADLLSYLGHDELQFQTQENGYIINRFGEPAKDLSEGEKTAIALLYFLKSLEDKNFKPKGIVVIDDPVSSMDEGALFHAFGYIKAKTKDAKQLIILTHNFMFFRQVKNWFQYVNERKKIPQKASFYQTKCAIKLGKRRSDLTPIDPLLIDYESEYHYLFHLVHAASLDTGGDLGAFYSIPNVARRVLESFLAFRNPSVKGGKDRLFTMLELTDYDQALKTKILRFVHSHSHEDHIGAPQHDPTLLAETPQIMKSLLNLIKTVDRGHYDGMMKVIAPPAATGVAAAAPAANVAAAKEVA